MLLELHQISGRHPQAKQGSQAAVRDISLRVSSGEQVAIIGPSGAGKTTALHLMACALKPVSGRMTLYARDPWQLPRRALQQLRGSIFLAPQLPPLPPRQRVVTTVLAGRLPHESFWTSLRSLFYPIDIPQAERALQAFDLSDKLFERVDRLSGGERQRAGLARALVSQATLMLVDEPLSALDPTRAQQVMQTLTQTAQNRGATLVATLHQVDMALAHFPRIIGLRDGQVAFDLPTQQVTQQHLHDLYAQQLHELTQPSTAAPFVDGAAASPTPAPVVMHCR